MALVYNFNVKAMIEDGRTTQSAVAEIKNWLTTTSLPEIPEELIALFLLSCNNVIQATRDTIKAYFKIKSEVPEIFNERDVDGEALKKALNTMHCGSLPVRMNDNVVVHFFKLNDTNYQNFNFVCLMKIAFMTMDIAQNRNPPNKAIIVIDAKGVGLMHLTCIKMWAFRKFLEFLQDALPLKIEMIYILNANYIVYKIFNMIKAFIKSELMATIKIYSAEMDMEQFHRDCVPASCLPREYSGELPSAEELNQRTIDQLRELKPFFEAEEKLRSCYK